MTGYVLPLTADPWQVMTLDLELDGEMFHAQLELRYLPAPDQWYVSIWDHSSSELLVNMIPLVCLRATDEPSTPDPAGKNLNEFIVAWGDTYDGT